MLLLIQQEISYLSFHICASHFCALEHLLIFVDFSDLKRSRRVLHCCLHPRRDRNIGHRLSRISAPTAPARQRGVTSIAQSWRQRGRQRGDSLRTLYREVLDFLFCQMRWSTISFNRRRCLVIRPNRYARFPCLNATLRWTE